MIIPTAQPLVFCAVLLHLAHALPAPKPATTAPALPRDTVPAKITTAAASVPTKPPVGRYVKRRPQGSGHQWSGPKGINLLGDEHSSAAGARLSMSNPLPPTPANPSAPSSAPSGFKIKTMFGTINCGFGGGWKNLWGGDKGEGKGGSKGGGKGGKKEKGHGGGGGGGGGGDNEEEHESEEEEHENNSQQNKWDNFVSQFQNIWQSEFNSETWQSNAFSTESWESESWTSAWSSFDNWSSQWASSNGWSSAWSSFEGWTSDFWTSDGWTSGASNFDDSMTTQESWVSGQGMSEVWSSANSERTASSQSWSVESGFTVITKTNSAGQPYVTMVPIE